MYMPYSLNPHLPRVRRDAVRLVREGWSLRAVARHTGFHFATISKWVQRAPDDGRMVVPTRSSRPHEHPHALPREVVTAIIEERRRHHRCAEVIHQTLLQRGIRVGLSSVKRTLKRQHLLRERSPWKRLHRSELRPVVHAPGTLVQVDTIHIGPPTPERFYVYTLLDVFSRWAYAWVARRITTSASVRFVRKAQDHAPFRFRMLQSDHGSEFSTHFTERLGLPHRHSRVRQANDNGHVERFNRTLQEECLRKARPDPWHYQRVLRLYLPYYNGERLHLGLQLKTPLQVLPRY